MDSGQCTSLAAFEEHESNFVYNDNEGRLEEVVTVDAEYDDEGIPTGTVVTEPVGGGRQLEFDASDFDRGLHAGERNVINQAVIENAEEVLIGLAFDKLAPTKRVLGPDHDYNHQHRHGPDAVEKVRDLLAAKRAYGTDAVAE